MTKVSKSRFSFRGRKLFIWFFIVLIFVVVNISPSSVKAQIIAAEEQCKLSASKAENVSQSDQGLIVKVKFLLKNCTPGKFSSYYLNKARFGAKVSKNSGNTNPHFVSTHILSNESSSDNSGSTKPISYWMSNDGWIYNDYQIVTNMNLSDAFSLLKSESAFVYAFASDIGVAKNEFTDFNQYLKIDKDSTPTTPIVEDYTPTEVRVCKLGSTTATICWNTKKASNSELLYGETTPNIFERDTNFLQKSHSVSLENLKSYTKYLYVVRSSPDANTTSTKTKEYDFTTHKADGTGGDTGGQTNPDPTNPDPKQPPAKDGKDINTNVTLSNIPDFDAKIGKGFFNPLGSTVDTVPKIIVRLIQILLAVVAGLTIITIIVAGFRMVLSSGNEEQVKKAKQALTWAIIGFVVSLLAFSMVAIIQRII